MEEEMFSEHYEEVLKLYGKSEADVQECLEIIKEWTNKLSFLPMHVLTDEYLKGLLIRNKFSIERCKSKIEKYFTFKHQYRHLFPEKFQEIIPSKQAQFYTPMIPLTDDYERVIIARIFDVVNYDIEKDCYFGFMIREFLQRYDYNCGEIIIFDASNLSSKVLLTKFRPSVLADLANLALKGYSARIKRVHIISKLANTLVNFLSPCLPAKLMDRIRIHDHREDLKEFIPSRCLPKEYGGDLKSLVEILKDFDKPFMKNAEMIHKLLHTTTKEWQGECLPGTFRKLAVD